MQILPAKLGYLKESKNIFNKEFKNLKIQIFTIWIEGTPLNYRTTPLEVYTKNYLCQENVCGPSGSDDFSFCVYLGMHPTFPTTFISWTSSPSTWLYIRTQWVSLQFLPCRHQSKRVKPLHVWANCCGQTLEVIKIAAILDVSWGFGVLKSSITSISICQSSPRSVSTFLMYL